MNAAIAIAALLFFSAGANASSICTAGSNENCDAGIENDDVSLLALNSKAIKYANGGGTKAGMQDGKTANGAGNTALSAKTCREFDIGTWKSNCPKDEMWLKRMRQAGGLVHNSFMNVGCNTGVDAVRFSQLWGNQSGVMAKWKTELAKLSTKEHGKADAGACGQNLLDDGDAEADHVSQSNPVVLCVEPGPSNVKILEGLRHAVFGDTSSFRVVPYAGSDHEGTGSFTADDSAGAEKGRLTKHQTANDVLVRVTTVDKMISEHGLTGLDGLVIDAECYDYAVLAGATNTLQSLRYLVFEVTQHIPGDEEKGCARDSPSNQLTLFSQLQMLDDHNFDCYWAGNNGRVQRLTGCWKESDDVAHRPMVWMNAVCVKRGDPWHSIFEELDTGI